MRIQGVFLSPTPCSIWIGVVIKEGSVEEFDASCGGTGGFHGRGFLTRMLAANVLVGTDS